MIKYRSISPKQQVKKRILALGPVSENHGEAKMFNHSCSCLNSEFELNVIDSVRFRHKFIRLVMNTVNCVFLLIKQRPTHFYLSYSRNKFMLLILFMAIIPIIKMYNVKCIYHVHDTSLKKELSGVIGKVVRLFYFKCISLTIIPNKTLLRYSLLHPSMNVEFLLNPFIGTSQHSDGARKNSYCFISFPSKNKNLNLVVELIQNQDKKLEVIGWSESDAKLLYPNLNVDTDKIKFIGKATHDKAMERLSGSLGLISVSDREAMPLTIIEALMRKVPVYVENHTGYRYFINNFASVNPIYELENASKNVNESSVADSYEKAKIFFDIRQYNCKLIKLFE